MQGQLRSSQVVATSLQVWAVGAEEDAQTLQIATTSHILGTLVAS